MKRIWSLIIAASFATHALAQSPAKPAVPAPAQAFYQKGQAAEKAGDPVAARQAYNDALRVDPNHANARYSLGQLKLNAGTIATKGREAKFAAVVIPEFRMDGATLPEALEALRIFVERQSKNEVAPNFIIQDPQKKFAPARISLNLKNTPAKAVLRYLMDMAGGKARYDEHAIVIMPN